MRFLPLTFFTLFSTLLSTSLASDSTNLDRLVRNRAHRRSSLENDTALTRSTPLVTRAPPSGWSLYIENGNDGGGCYQDYPQRALGDLSISFGDAASLETCMNACHEKGYAWAAVEFYDQCFCSYSKPSLNSAPSSDCSARCKSGEQCGGVWRMNVYSYTAPSTSSDNTALTASQPIHGQWQHQGCYRDSSQRVLSSWSYSDDRMTAFTCLSACQSQGYALAGVEFGRECYCSNSIDTAQLPDSSCDMTCAGGAGRCGQVVYIHAAEASLLGSGFWALNLYKFASSSTEVATTSPSTSPSPTASPSTTPSASASSWSYHGCYEDGPSRVLSYSYWDANQTPAKCLSHCQDRGYAFGGVEFAVECWCGNSLNGGKVLPESSCNMACGGGGTGCGGFYAISLFSYGNGATTSPSSFTTASATTTGPATTTTNAATTAATTASPSPAATQASTNSGSGSYTVNKHIPGSNSNKAVWAHHIVGNTYHHSYDTWRDEIRLAQSAGIDGFMLNVGPDSWQPDRVKDAYNAAHDMGFKMILSFDMTEFQCWDWSRGPLFQYYLGSFINHPAAGQYNGKSILTTFAGEGCTFGHDSVNNGWNAVMGQFRSQIYFAPAFNAGPTSLGGFNIDAEVNWGSAWPDSYKEIETSRDKWFMQNLGGKGYIGTVSPVFAAHLNYKNWIWRGDNFLYAARWDQLLEMRDSIDHVEIVSWNDYGESSYIGPIRQDMPEGAKYYANDNFQHTDILSLQAFYSAAWKQGSYPAITKDQIWAMARPHPVWAGADGAPPDHRDMTNDAFYVQVHLTASASVILCAGSDCETKQGQAGINRFSKGIWAGQTVYAKVERDGQKTAEVSRDVPFDGSPSKYNFNYWIKSS